MRIVTRYDEILRTHFVDRLDSGLLVDVERDIALPLEVLARRHAQFVFAAGTIFLPLIIEAPQPPVQPSRGAFEKCAAQLRVAFEYAAGRHARDGTHQLDRIADRMCDRKEVG